MTVKDEIAQHQEYNKLKLAEFLEFLARIAFAKYHDENGMKIDEMILNIMRPYFKLYNKEAKNPEDAEQDDVTSEESINGYDF